MEQKIWTSPHNGQFSWYGTNQHDHWGKIIHIIWDNLTVFGMDIIPELNEIGKPEFFTPFLKTQTSFKKLIQWKAELSKSSGFLCPHIINPEVLLFIGKNPKLLNLKAEKSCWSSGFRGFPISQSSGIISIRFVVQSVPKKSFLHWIEKSKVSLKSHMHMRNEKCRFSPVECLLKISFSPVLQK